MLSAAPASMSPRRVSSKSIALSSLSDGTTVTRGPWIKAAGLFERPGGQDRQKVILGAEFAVKRMSRANLQTVDPPVVPVWRRRGEAYERQGPLGISE